MSGQVRLSPLSSGHSSLLQAGQSEYEHRSFDDGGSEDLRDRRRGGDGAGHSKNSSVSERDRKIGHRRINEGGVVSYKKIETNTLMGSIQLGIQAAIGGLAKYAERDLLMQDFMTGEIESLSLVSADVTSFQWRRQCSPSKDLNRLLLIRMQTLHSGNKSGSTLFSFDRSSHTKYYFHQAPDNFINVTLQS